MLHTLICRVALVAAVAKVFLLACCDLTKHGRTCVNTIFFVSFLSFFFFKAHIYARWHLDKCNLVFGPCNSFMASVCVCVSSFILEAACAARERFFFKLQAEK